MEKLLGLPVLASEHGAKVDQLIIYVHYLMLALFIGWSAYFLYVVVRFRKSKHPKADYHGVKNHAASWIEGGVIFAEAALLIGLAIPLWHKSVDEFPPAKDSTEIQIMAQQFSWNFRYPGKDGVFGKQDIHLVSTTNNFGLVANDEAGKDDIQGANEMHVPVNKPVIIYLSSRDVIHSFKVIAFRTTQDAMPGLKIPIWFKPVKEGRYQINCAQLCGMGHFAMAQGYMIVESQENFDKWIAEKSKTGGAPQALE